MKQSIINYYVRRQLRLDARQDGGKWGYNKGVANGKRKAGEKKKSGGEIGVSRGAARDIAEVKATYKKAIGDAIKRNVPSELRDIAKKALYLEPVGQVARNGSLDDVRNAYKERDSFYDSLHSTGAIEPVLRCIRQVKDTKIKAGSTANSRVNEILDTLSKSYGIRVSDLGVKRTYTVDDFAKLTSLIEEKSETHPELKAVAKDYRDAIGVVKARNDEWKRLNLLDEEMDGYLERRYEQEHPEEFDY